MDGSVTPDSRLARWRGQGLDFVVLGCMATLALLQSYRVFVPYLVFEIDQSERTTLAQIAGAVFALTFLGAVLVRVLGGRWTMLAAAALLIATRLGLQFSEDPGYRWVLGAGAIIAWAWIFTVMLPKSGNSTALGIGFAFGIDLILRALRRTLDLPWMPGLTEHAVTLIIVIALGLAAYLVATGDRLSAADARASACLRFVGIGSGIGLWLVIAGNLGFASEQADLGAAAAFGLLALGVIVALVAVLAPARHQSRTIDRAWIAGMGVAGLIAIGVWYRESARWLEIISLPVMACAVTLLTMRCAAADSSSAHAYRWRTGAAITVGLLLQVVFVFAYFAQSGPLGLLLLPLAVVTLAGLAGEASFGLPQLSRGMLVRFAGALGLAALLTFGWLIYDASSGDSTESPAGNLTVMTYNVQEGFSNANIWSLEETARTIEAQDPDVVILQEITRGWLVMSSVDQVRWLADRLDMEFAYSGNSHDGLWGNAILSRFPIEATHSVTFSTTDNLRRGAVAIEIDTANGPLLVIDTHLDNPKAATDMRLEQIEELTDFWAGRSPAIIAGDFNADPGSAEWQAMTDAGLVDSGAGTDETTSEDERRIDYIFVTPDLSVVSYAVPDVWTSDHRPVVVELAMPG